MRVVPGKRRIERWLKPRRSVVLHFSNPKARAHLQKKNHEIST
jgi:hypothetical protein